MKIRILSIFCWFFIINLHAQEIYMVSDSNKFRKDNILTCTFTELPRLPFSTNITDFAYTPDGKLYVIPAAFTTALVSLYEIDEATGAIRSIFRDRSFGSITSLTSDNNGVLYFAGENLFRVDPKAARIVIERVGGLPERVTGDLVFHKGKLYYPSDENDLIEVDFQNTLRSPVYMRLPTRYLGAARYSLSCDSARVFLTALNAQEIHEVNFGTRTISTTCAATNSFSNYTPARVSGAGDKDFRGLFPVRFDSIKTRNNVCQSRGGQIEVFHSGGGAPYYYSIDGGNFQLSPVFDSVTNGNHRVVVQDKYGCKARDTTIFIGGTNPPTLDAVSVRPVHCNQAQSGSIRISARPQVSTHRLRYSLDGRNYGTNPAFLQLSAGQYNIWVKDSNGCITQQAVRLDSVPTPIINNIATQHTTCANPNGQLQITATNGNTAPLLFRIDSLSAQSNGLFRNLRSGTYRVQVSDSLGCSVTDTVSILPSSGVGLRDVSVVATSCGRANGRISASGQLLGINPNFRLTFSLNQSPPSMVGIFDSLTGGNYQLYAHDGGGCRDSASIRVGSSDSLKIQAVDLSPSRCDAPSGQITIRISGNNGTPSYSLNGGTFVPNSVFTELIPNQYQIVVRDTQGCVGQVGPLFLSPLCAVFAPNAFTPNGDGNNDGFTFFSHVDWVSVIEELAIFNRSGTQIFIGKDLPINETKFGWDGNLGSEPLDAGVFIYTGRVRLRNGEVHQLQGDVTLLR